MFHVTFRQREFHRKSAKIREIFNCWLFKRVSKTKNHVYETVILRNSEAESLLILNTEEKG